MQAVLVNDQPRDERLGAIDPERSGKMDQGERDRHNVGSVERLLSVVVGAVILFALRRKLLVYLGAACVAGYLLYRGSSGRCLIYEAVNIDTADLDLSRLPHAAIDRQSRKADTNNGTMPRDHIVDEIDEALTESFPASDPPANW